MSEDMPALFFFHYHRVFSFVMRPFSKAGDRTPTPVCT